jgi:two-component system nitrate/nitrite response regulator NarL
VTEVVDLAQRRERTRARPGMALSVREVEVLTELSHGQSYEDIADSLEITLDTVKSHLKRIFVKLGARNGAHAVGKAYRTGLLGGDDAA